MKKYKEEEYKYTKLIPISIQCDICGKEYDCSDDIMETQEFLKIDFIGGYASPFGDGSHVQCDICQHCLYKMISKYAKIKNLGLF